MRTRILLGSGLIALTLLGAASARPGFDAAEDEVLARIEARDLPGARAGIVALRALAGPGESHRGRRAELLDLGVALAGEGAPGAGALAWIERMRGRVEPRDLHLLRELEHALGVSGAVYLAPLRRAARTGVGPRQPRSLLLELAKDDDPELRRLAVSALATQVLPFRARVLAGEDLGPAEQRALASRELIEVLVARLADRPAAGATDHLPADLAATSPGVATALHALVLVEAPALDVLREDLNRPGAREAIAAIESAIALRLRRHPQSTWCSARGDTPREGPTRATCGECARPIPAAAKFCPSCGARARVPCPTCLASLDVNAEGCGECGASSHPPHAVTCKGCKAVVRVPGKFCPECGGELR